MKHEPEAGSTLPLILGFFLIAFLVVAGAVAAGDAYVDQRGVQHLCDGAAAAAASELDLDRSGPIGAGSYADFDAASRVATAVDTYLARDPDRSGVTASVTTSANRQRLTLRCGQRLPVTFGSLFGKGAGVQHNVTSAVRSALSD